MKLRVSLLISALMGLVCAAPPMAFAQDRDHEGRGGGRPPMMGGFGGMRPNGGYRQNGGFRQPGGFGRGYGQPGGYGRSGYGAPGFSQPAYGGPGYAGYGAQGFRQPGYGRGYPPGGGAAPPAAYGDGRYGYPGAGFDGDWRQQQNEVRRAVREGRHIPLGQAIATVRQHTPGHELDAGLEPGPGGRSVYRLRWAAANGRRIDYLIDAATGAIISVQGGR